MNPTKTNPQTILKRLTISRKGIKIITHERPDVDALGSVAGTGWVLNSMRVPFSVYVESWLSFCPELRPPVSASEVDVQLMLDVSDPKRAFGYDQGLETLVIDHHAVENVPFINLIDPSCCATSALLSELFFDHLDSKSSVCFLAGLLADTGVLSYSNVDERALKDAIRLVQAGANWNAAYVEATKICGMEQAKRIVRLLKKVYEYKPGIFVLSVPKEDRLEHSFTDDDFSIALSIMQWIGRGILFISARENNNQTPVTNISFRSRHPLEAIEYAKRLNGGGHRMAAAAKLSNQLSEVMETVLTWVTADVEALSEAYNEPANLNELDLQLAELYAKSELLSVDVTEELLLSMCDLVSKGASAERAAMKVRENISLESLQELSDWILSKDDLKSPKSLVQRMFYRQVDFSCKS